MNDVQERKPHILIVDDDARIRDMLCRYFEGEGFEAEAVPDGHALWSSLKQNEPDLVLLDLMLPGEDGFTLARQVRSHCDIPIIMLTGRNDVVDRVVGLEIGADDYIAKPFHLREVLARVRTVLRRQHGPAMDGAHNKTDTVLHFDGWCLDIGRRQLIAADGSKIDLTTAEFDMLAVLVQRPGYVFSRDRLMDLTRGRNLDPYDRVIDTQIARLRKKIEHDPKRPELIKSVRGVGYVFTGKVDQ